MVLIFYVDGQLAWQAVEREGSQNEHGRGKERDSRAPDPPALCALAFSLSLPFRRLPRRLVDGISQFK